jgi:chromate reductase
MGKPKILAIVGSLRKNSYNLQLAEAAAEILGDRADFKVLEYRDVPMMNQDIEFPPPEAVSRVRQEVKEADGIWFFTPEYNHFFSGALKNLLDWLSRPVSDDEGQVLSSKPAAISGTSPGMSGTCVAQDHLMTLLNLLNMKVMNVPRLTVPNVLEQVDEEGRLRLDSSYKYLRKQVDAFLEFIEKSK